MIGYWSEFMIHSSIFMKTLIVCCAVGLSSWLILEISYADILRSTARIGKPRRRWLRELEKNSLKYYKKPGAYGSTELFAEKVFRKKKIFGFRSSFWIKLERLAIAGCSISGAAGALILSQQGKELTEVMISYITGITAASGLLFLDTFLQAEEKQRRILINLSEYLENMQESGTQVQVSGEAEKTEKEKNRKIIHYAGETPDKKRASEQSPPVTPEEEKLLEDVLQEYFV